VDRAQQSANAHLSRARLRKIHLLDAENGCRIAEGGVDECAHGESLLEPARAGLIEYITPERG
jgi:hypothetical protein